MLESVWERLRAFGCKQTEHILYWISIWCVLGVGLVYIAAFYIAHVTGNDRLLQCKMKLYFWNPLPGLWWNKSNMVSVTWKSTAGSILQCICGIWCSMVSIVFYQSDCAACGGSF